MNDILSYIALVIAAYGAGLSTYSAVKGRRTLLVKYGQGFLCFEDKSMTTYSTIEITNKSTIPIYIRQYGFEVSGQNLAVRRIEDALFKNAQKMAFNQHSHALIPLNIVDNNFVGEIDEIKPGKSVSACFYTKDLKKVYVLNSRATIHAICTEQTGKKFHVKVSKELVLSTQEVID